VRTDTVELLGLLGLLVRALHAVCAVPHGASVAVAPGNDRYARVRDRRRAYLDHRLAGDHHHGFSREPRRAIARWDHTQLQPRAPPPPRVLRLSLATQWTNALRSARGAVRWNSGVWA
jgi:hypothetical protein